MEKVTVTQCFQKGLTKKGNPYFAVTLADGREATCFDKEIPNKLNQEIEAELKQQEYQGEVQYVLNLPGSNNFRKGGGGFNLAFNQRKTALEVAVNSFNGRIENGKEITERADYLLTWLKQE